MFVFLFDLILVLHIDQRERLSLDPQRWALYVHVHEISKVGRVTLLFQSFSWSDR